MEFATLSSSIIPVTPVDETPTDENKPNQPNLKKRSREGIEDVLDVLDVMPMAKKKPVSPNMKTAHAILVELSKKASRFPQVITCYLWEIFFNANLSGCLPAEVTHKQTMVGGSGGYTQRRKPNAEKLVLRHLKSCMRGVAEPHYISAERWACRVIEFAIRHDLSDARGAPYVVNE
jgi:hypothetical protein